MLNDQQYDQLLDDVKKEFPDFKIVYKKDSSLMKSINFFLKTISFGKMKTFMDSFITTIGETVYVPTDWHENSASTKAITIRHERVHMRQAKKYGRVLFSIMYLLLPIPIGAAYFRAKFEKEAYEESLKAVHEYYGSKLFTNSLKESILKHFTTAEYIWMWPWKKSLDSWYDAAVDRIKNSK